MWTTLNMLAGRGFTAKPQEQPQHEEGREKQDQQESECEREEAFFLESMTESGVFEHAVCALDEVDDATATRLLGWACIQGKSPDIINKIGNRCRDLSAWSLSETTPLQLSVRFRHLRGMEELLRMGADVNRRSGSNAVSTALQEAVESGCLASVKTLLEREEIEVDAPNGKGQTALYLCVCFFLRDEDEDEDEDEERNDTFADIAMALINRGADMLKGTQDETPLSLAIECEAYDIFLRMVRFGKKPPAQFVEQYMEHLKANETVFEMVVHAGWVPRVADDETRAALASQVISDVTRAAPHMGPEQLICGNRDLRQSLPLHDAVRSGNLSAVEELLSAAKGLNVTDREGLTALHLAATLEGRIDILEAFVRHKESLPIDTLDKNSQTALFRAVVADNAEAVKILLDAKASTDVKDSYGLSPLSRAVQRPAGAVLEVLLASQESWCHGGEEGLTPLHTACEYDAPGTVEALLRAGALPGHCWNKSLQSPLLMACKMGNLGAVRKLLPHLSKRQINMRSAVEAGAQTPLSAAIACDNLVEVVDIVEALLAAGADPHVLSPLGQSALFTVLNTNRVAANPTIGPQLVRALVANGADVNEVSIPKGCTPLHIACAEGACAAVVQALLELGADARAPCVGEKSMSPLHLAAGKGGDPGVVRILMEQPHSGGLNAVGVPPLDRNTTLYVAVKHNKAEVVRFLLEEGADMDLLPQAEDGIPLPKSMIEFAASRGCLDAMNLLIQAKMFKDQAEKEQQAKDADTNTGASVDDARC